MDHHVNQIPSHGTSLVSCDIAVDWLLQSQMSMLCEVWNLPLRVWRPGALLGERNLPPRGSITMSPSL